MDSIKFYLRFNWIYGGLDCKKNWFLSQFRLLLEEIKVLGSNYNLEELIWSNQRLNCIIIEVCWPIRDLIEIIRNQGPNRKRRYNQVLQLQLFRGAWLQDCKNIQGPNQKYHLKWQNGAVSEALFIVFFTDSAKRNRFSNKCRWLWGTFHSYYLSTVTTAIMVPNVFIIYKKKKRIQFWL